MNRRFCSRLALASLCLSLFSFGCGTASVKSKAYDPRSATSSVRPTALSHELAWLRSKQLGKVTYVLWFGLDDQSEVYEGRVVANFELKDLKKTIPNDVLNEAKEAAQIVALDFEGGDIQSISVNGAPVNLADNSSHFKQRYDGHRIYFHSSELLPSGANRIAISFTQHFSHDGRGFHRFKDPEDGRVYVYTNSEPYDAHRIFPCFDQPDLKASYELTVEAPPEWEIISNTMERDVSNVDGRKSWAFPPSPVFSTYLFEIAGGPFAVWKSDSDGMPLRLFARQALKPYISEDDWFTPTQKGLEYYNSYFSYPYPYAKFDEIIVPEFGAGAMENVAAITFSERFVHRSKTTMLQRRSLASVILHEMAHQWFGDLVTMKWWNGLWLNESFATYMSARALAEATEFPDVWQEFHGEKEWALWTDQLVTTHPIEVPVPDTESAESNFDGITYGKGASVLKQLNFYLGDDDFREGLQRYFMRYALRNTTTHDFIRMLSEASGKDLTKWQKSWLQTAGVNGLKVDWACNADGEITKFSLLQTPAVEGQPDLRTHKAQIALYDIKGSGSLKPRNKGTVDVTYSGAATPLPDLIGKTCPAFVFPNNEDYDYAKVELDPASLDIARKNINRFDSPLMRRVIWNALQQMMVDGKMRPQDYFDAFLAQGAGERNTDLLGSLLDDIMTLSLQRSFLRYLPPGMQKDYAAKLETQAMKSLKTSGAGSDLQRIWFDAFIRIANSADGAAFAAKLLKHEVKLPGLTIGQAERWDLIGVLARTNTKLDDQDPSALIAQELKKDPSDMGVEASLRARVMMPDPASRQKWLSIFLLPIDGKPATTEEGVTLNPYRLRTMVGTYFNVLDPAAAQSGSAAYFEAIPKLTALAENPYAQSFTRSLYPSLCDPANVTKTTAVLNAAPNLPASVSKQLKISRQEEERCIRARAKASEGTDNK